MLMKILGAAVLATFVATTSQAAPLTFQVSSSGPFEDAILGSGSINGSITGSFTVNDDGDGIVESGEITAFSFVTDLDGTVFDLTIAGGAANTLIGSAAPVAIGAGLSADSLDFSFIDVGDFIGDILIIDLDEGFISLFAEADPNFFVLESTNFTITPPDAIPLPAPLAMMLGGIAVFGFVARRRKQA